MWIKKVLIRSRKSFTSWYSCYTKSLVHAVFNGAFVICAYFRNIPQYLVHAVYPLLGRVNPSFVGKLVTMHIINCIGVFLVFANFSEAKQTHQARTRCRFFTQKSEKSCVAIWFYPLDRFLSQSRKIKRDRNVKSVLKKSH